MPLALPHLAALCLAALAMTAGAQYQFALNGEPIEPRIVSLDGEDTAPKAGDMVWVDSFLFVLGEPGDYQFHRLPSDPDRLWSSDASGRRTIIACRVREADSLAAMEDEQLPGLRGIEFHSWPRVGDGKLALLDLPRCFVSVSCPVPRSQGSKLPAIPKGIRYLSIGGQTGLDEDMAWLEQCTELSAFSYDGDRKEFDAAWFPKGENLRMVDLSFTKFVHPKALARLQGLRRLQLHAWVGARDLDALKGLRNLRRLDISFSAVTDLTALAQLKSIQHVVAYQIPSKRLPTQRIPTLAQLDILGSRITREQIEAFAKANPQCLVNSQHMAVLRPEIAVATKLRVRTGGNCHREPVTEQTLFETADPAEIQGVIAMIGIQDDSEYGSCMCCGEPSIEFYRGDRKVATLSMHHGEALRWAGWPSDGSMTAESSEALSRWLAQIGAPKPLEDWERHRRGERLAKHFQKVLEAILPPAAIEARQHGKNEGEAMLAVGKVIARHPLAAEICLRLLGRGGSWSSLDQYDEMVKQVLPKIAQKKLAAVAMKPGDEAANGLARWLYGEEKWREWSAENLTRVLASTGLDGASDAHTRNRRQTLLALGQIATPPARSILRSVLRQQVTVRPLDPDTGESDDYGTNAPQSRHEAIPAICTDQVHAAIWLALLRDEKSAAEIAALVPTLEGESRISLEEAIARRQ